MCSNWFFKQIASVSSLVAQNMLNLNHIFKYVCQDYLVYFELQISSHNDKKYMNLGKWMPHNVFNFIGFI